MAAQEFPVSDQHAGLPSLSPIGGAVQSGAGMVAGGFWA